MEFQANPRDIRILMDLADEGTLGLPEFQRNFIWRPPAVADLLRTVARNWPAGSFLLLEGPQNFACKPLEDAPQLIKEPTLLILDGQQRITALYQAFRNESTETYYVDMHSLLEAGELEDEHLAYQKKSRFAKRFPNIKAAAEEGLITIPMLADDQQFFRWVSFASENQQDALVDLRDKQLSGFKFYSIPCVILPKDVPLSALAKIFETINRTGVRLDAFDLMVAKLYPSDFYLRDEWEEARGDFKLLQDFDVEGIEVLKLIALMEHIRQLAQPGPTPVKGVRQSDVLQLDPTVVKEMWNLAVLSYHGALEFLHDRCSVVSSSLLPAKAMVLAVSCALRIDESHRQDFESDVERWFWAATFQQTYSQGANTQTVADAKALRAWDSDLHAVPRDVREFKLDSELLQDQTRRNEMLIRGIGCLLAKRGARDWIKDEEISGNHVSIDFHHVFASKHLQSIGIGESDLVINLTPIFSSSNQSLRNDPPSVVAKRDDVVRSAVESHFIDWHRFTDGHWNDFLSARSERLEALIYEAVR